MAETEIKFSFIHEWLKKKRTEGKLNQKIIDAIGKCLGGLMNEELDEANLLKLLQEIECGEKK